jgi:PAS domain S-box-containing protein
LPAIAILALTSYIAFLVVVQYHSQEELLKVSLNRFFQENEKRATFLDNFVSNCVGDVVALSENQELLHYYQNLALGMSMEYGLGASLAECNESFRRAREQHKLVDRPVYTRLTYVDATGHKLIDTHEPGLFAKEERSWRAFLSPESDRAKFMIDEVNGRKYVIISSPYTFKQKYSGQLLAWVSVDFIHGYFIGMSSRETMLISTLLFEKEYIGVPENIDLFLAPAQLPDARKLELNRPLALTLTDARGHPLSYLGVMTPVGQTPFAIGTFMPRRLGSGQNSPIRLLTIMTGLGIIILGGGIILMRAGTRNAVLQAHLEETRVREKIVADKNASLRKLSTAVDQSGNAIVIMARNGTIEYVNPQFVTMTGYGSAEVLGKNPLELSSGVDNEALLGAMGSAIDSGQRWSGERPNKRVNGESYWEYTTIAPVRDESGSVTNFIAVTEEITERKIAEEEIRALNADLEQRVRDRTAALQASNTALEKAYIDLKSAQSQILQQEKMASIGQLAAGVAHEINNPTGFILSNLTSLRKYCERLTEFVRIQSKALDEIASDGQASLDVLLASVHEQRKALKVNQIVADVGDLITESIEGGQRVKQIVQNLKNFSRVDDLANKPSDINKGLDDTITIAWNEIKYKATVAKEYGDVPLTVCNLGQLNQVFLNLIVNAAQAIEGKGEIRVRTWREEDNILVAISDTGCGIPEDIVGRVFEPFFTTKEVGKGTGLGLSIAYDIIRKHNGRIDVQSKAGAGTTFTITLPVVGENRERIQDVPLWS